MKRGRDVLFKTFPKVFPLLLILWVLLVLYPNPVNLAVSIGRAVDPGIDPAAVASLAQEVPEDPAGIELAVCEAFPYSYDWESYGMPWYFPTVQEVIEEGRGDCKARALVVASILEYKGIPYRLQFSPIHMWVEYEGKESSSLENSGALFYELDPDTGRRIVRLPGISLKEAAKASWNGFWPPMPLLRKVLITVGTSLLVTALVISIWRSKNASRFSGSETNNVGDKLATGDGSSADGDNDGRYATSLLPGNVARTMQKQRPT